MYPWWTGRVLPPRPERLFRLSQRPQHKYIVYHFIAVVKTFFRNHYEHSANPQHIHFDAHGTPGTRHRP
jgi:hypothetical protein